MFNETWNPPNRFELFDMEWEVEPPKARLQILEDDTRGILSHNRRSDIDFDWAVNPYRGCTHACAYCYARTFHEFLGYGAGSDFERRIVVKTRAPELLREAFDAPRWRGERVALSSATDGYQPLERRYELTRRCLEVCAAYRNPVSIVTRSPLVLRDLPVLQELAAHGAVAVTLSVPIPDPAIARALEPGAPSPTVRLQALRALAQAGIPVGVSVAPVIPGLTDSDLPKVLTAAREAGARWAWFAALRLPGSVAEVFQRRLRDQLPERADAVMAKVCRAGIAGDDLGERPVGHRAPRAFRAARDLFELWHARLGFGESWVPPDPGPFRRPGRGRQLALFSG